MSSPTLAKSDKLLAKRELELFRVHFSPTESELPAKIPDTAPGDFNSPTGPGEAESPVGFDVHKNTLLFSR